MSSNTKISVVINTYNAERYLDEVLQSVQGFDEIVVCDMESTDSTTRIAQTHGSRVIVFPKNGHNICEVARDFAIHSATNDWVLVVDADELVTESLREWLYDFVKHPGDVTGLYVSRQNRTMGVPLPAQYPDYQLRFFRQTLAVWHPVIHSRPEIQGVVSHIPRNRHDLALQHLEDGTSSYLRRLNTYSDYEVERRTDTKVTLAKLIFQPLFRFFKMYFLKRGFLHGKAGFIQATRSFIYKFTVLCKLYEKQSGLS